MQKPSIAIRQADLLIFISLNNKARNTNNLTVLSVQLSAYLPVKTGLPNGGKDTGIGPLCRTLTNINPTGCLSMKANQLVSELPEADLDRIVEMAWEDRTPFEAIQAQYGLSEQSVIELMRAQLKPTSWRRWRARVQGRSTKHAALSLVDDARFKSNQQRTITQNKLAKR